uniref:F-box domain-containing protein n=1 Tax=Meloidogyne incognita TaxID=6306 RepID=A0A914M5B7_MELIC
MFSLPPEVQLDVLKCLNFNQLFAVKLTNFYLLNLINKYEGGLARMKFRRLSIVGLNFLLRLSSYKSIEPQSGVFKFILDAQLKDKWQAAIDKSIPLFLHQSECGRYSYICIEKTPSHLLGVSYFLKLANFPINIEEMIIVRCWLEHLFKCVFEWASFVESIFNIYSPNGRKAITY